MRVKPFEKLGRGSSKQAFTIQENTAGAPHNFTIPDGSDVTKFCIVLYTTPIQWLPKSSYSENFIKFLKDMTDPQFKRDFNNNSIPKTYIFNDNEIKLYENMYNNRKRQFECIAELKKMMELGELFAPKLHQIRIDIVYEEYDEEYGTPFSPNEMDSKFEEIGNNIVFVSYLVERCDESVIKFVSKNGEKKPEVAAKMIEFIDSYVETQNELNCDIKSDNFCPKIIEGRVISIRLLDVDPKFCIKGGDTPEFKRNAKVFMKYAFITHSVKWGQKIGNRRATINFGNMGITQNDVDAAIHFFYRPEYMVYEFNPLNMLYHYFVNLDPGNFVELPGWEIQIIEKTNYAGEKIKVKQFYNKHTNEKTYFLPFEYEFLSYDKLILYFRENPYKIIELFKELNKEIGIVLLSGGGGGPDEKESIERYSEDTTNNARYTEEERKGGSKRKRKSKKRKNRKRKHTRKV